MRDGFIRVAAGTPDIRVADCAYNAETSAALAKRAAALGARILVLPELGLTGYTCGDLFLQRTLLDGALDAVRFLCAQTEDLDLLLIVGLPVPHRGKIYNCAGVISHGRLLGLVPKTYLPSYGEFNETRWFTPAPENCELWGAAENGVLFGTKQLFYCMELPELSIGIELCEDLWAPAPPSVGLALAGATVIANLSASNELVGKDAYRRALVVGQSARLTCGYLYADAGEGESTTDLVFAAHNMIAEDGILLSECGPFENSLTIAELDLQKITAERRRLNTFPPAQEGTVMHIPFSLTLGETELTRTISPTPFLPPDQQTQASCFENVLRIQSHGLKKRLVHTNAKSAVIGISGGLDSALALLVAVRAMDLTGRAHTDIHAVTMPCFGTTARTKGNAERLCERLGTRFSRIDITKAVQGHFCDIGQDPEVHDAAYENAQARERTQVLMDLANQENGLVIGTGDLSELALGWATYNGDHMSMYGVNASVPKTLVKALVGYEALRTDDRELCRVLQDILDTPVSPELLPPEAGEIGQKTEDLVGPYELHDFFLYYVVRWAFSPRKIYRLALHAFEGVYDGQTILHWMNLFYRRFFSQQFKRSCLPDGPKTGSVSLSPRGDWRMPSDGVAALWLSEIQKLHF